MSGSMRGASHIYDSIDPDESDGNPYSYNRSSSASNDNIPIYATVNKTSKRPQSTAPQATITKIPPKTPAKPQPHTPSSPSSRQSKTFSHVYDLPDDVIKDEDRSLVEEAESGENSSTNQMPDVMENVYDDIPGQMSPVLPEESDQRSRQSSGNRENGGSVRGWPKLPPLRNTDPSNVKEVSVQYLGTIRLTEDELKVEGSAVVIRRCLAHYTQPANSHNLNIIHEWTPDTNMQLIIDEDSLRVKQSPKSLASDDLLRLRIWGHGKETDSPVFGYIARDDSSSGLVCRVFKCREGTGQQVTSFLGKVCTEKLNKCQPTSADPADPSKKGKSENSIERTSSNETKVSLKCRYVGKFSFTENSGKEELKSLVEIRTSSPQDSWVKVSLELSESQILVRDSKNHDLVHIGVKDIVGIGINKDNNKFAGITVRSLTSMTEFMCHVFYCEPTTDYWLVSIQSVCKAQLNESKSGIMKKMNKYFIGNKKN